ncbi:hypothetical protein [Polaribacter atrinae]|uniref:hypothetical protein n=1 Tax=Polaribacter atrinae TaxID=1333662 RepID=UPI0030FD1572
MKTIDEITVTVTYKVGLGGFKASEKAFNQLADLERNCVALNEGNVDKNQDALDWLTKNIIEKDGFMWEYEIDTFEASE